MNDRHNGITADESDVKQLQLHTHKVQAKSTCKFGAHDKRLACLGVDKYSGKKWKRSRKDLPETVLSRRGLIRGKGKMVIFIVVPPSENVTNRKITTRQRREHWFHLDRSYD